MAPQTKTKKELAHLSSTFGSAFDIVEHKSVLYLPVDYETFEPQVTDPTRRVWIPLPHEDVIRLAGSHQDILFQTESEKRRSATGTLVQSISVALSAP